MKKLLLLIFLCAFSAKAQNIFLIYTNGTPGGVALNSSFVSNSTAGKVWTATDSFGNGAWSNAAAGGTNFITNSFGEGTNLLLRTTSLKTNLVLIPSDTAFNSHVITVVSNNSGAAGPILFDVSSGGVVTAHQYAGDVTNNATLTGSYTADCRLETTFHLTVTGNATVTVTNIPAGGAASFRIDGDASHTVSWVNVYWSPSGFVPVQTLNHSDFYYIANLDGDYVGSQYPNYK